MLVFNSFNSVSLPLLLFVPVFILDNECLCSLIRMTACCVDVVCHFLCNDSMWMCFVICSSLTTCQTCSLDCGCRQQTDKTDIQISVASTLDSRTGWLGV